MTASGCPDCAAVWQEEFGEAPPELVAYVGTEGGIVVQPKAWPTPAGGKPLPEGFTFDSALLELDHSLQDYLHGLPSRCHSVAQARAMVEATSARLGLTGWKVEQRDDPDGVTSCAAFIAAEPEDKVVRLMADPNPGTIGERYQVMGAKLRKAPTCLSREEARSAVREAATEAGVPEGAVGYKVAEPFARSGNPPTPATGTSGSGCVHILMMVQGWIMVELWE